ncbi:DUF2515 family protein [Paraburkholderia sp. GV068]|uniref:DUF2515 family protein n=1 Tax=unclassified Paraburkholderia TaxID=2615204 RepID=UPI0035BFAF90
MGAFGGDFLYCPPYSGAGPSSGRSTTVCLSESRDPQSRRGLPQSIAAISQWALNIPTGSAREIQLTLANECTTTGANAKIEMFSRQPLANLADPGQRMAFVLRAANRFNDLLHDPIEKHMVENSIFLIAHPR